MLNYVNTDTMTVHTKGQLACMGLPVDDALEIAAAGFVPLRYDYPDYDARTQTITPKPKLTYDKASGQYVQKFKIEALSADAVAVNLQHYKEERLERLKSAWLEAEASGIVEVGEVGFAIDANDRANRDIEGLITSMEMTGREQTMFCAADNTFHEVTLDQLKAMRLAVIAHGQALYERKWLLRTGIEQAATFEAVDAVEISFAEV